MNDLALISLILSSVLALFTLFINYKVDKAKRMLGRAEIYRQIGADRKNWVNQVKEVIVGLHGKLLQYQSEKNQKTLNEIKILQTEAHLLLNTEDADYLGMNANNQIKAVFEKQNLQIQKLSDQIDELLPLIQNDSTEEDVDGKMSMIKDSAARVFYDEWKKIKWELSFKG